MTGTARRVAHYFVPWAGWVAGGLGWAISDQVGSDLAQANCAAADPLLMVTIAAIGAAIALAGGLVSLRHWRHSAADTGADQAGARRFLALVSSMAAGLFLVAILFQAASSLIIPRCHA
jgi:hypothetical protein